MPFASLQETQKRLEEQAAGPGGGGIQIVDWQFRLVEAPIKNFFGCFTSFFCIPCVTCQQRQRLLDITGRKYACCGGSFCCCSCPEVDPPMDKFCMCMESCWCPMVAGMVNRDYIMGSFYVRFDPCDEYLITCSAVLQCVVCILQCFMDVPDEINDLIDLFTLCIMSCSLAQQEAEIDWQIGESTCLGGRYGTEAGAGRFRKGAQPGGGEQAVLYPDPEYQKNVEQGAV